MVLDEGFGCKEGSLRVPDRKEGTVVRWQDLFQFGVVANAGPGKVGLLVEHLGVVPPNLLYARVRYAEGVPMGPLRKPEVMSPAGYWPQLRAAIEAGADAVYFGLKHFSARAKVGFSLAELPEAMATLHRRGVKGYITFNTLVFNHELDEAARALAEIAAAGADAVIVQDVGVARMAKQIAPDLDIHGSTQMSVTRADGVRLAHSFGVSRVTLARELSLAEVRSLLIRWSSTMSW